MIENLNFDTSGVERMMICQDAEKPFDYQTLTHEQKVIFVHGMNAGYYQGKREQARETIDRMTMALVGFKP